MSSIAHFDSRFHIRPRFQLKAFLLPAVVLLCVALGISLLWSVRFGILVFALIFGATAMIIEPFFGVMLFMTLLYTRPFETMPIPRSIPVMKLVAIGTLACWLLHIIVSRGKKLVKAPQNILMIAFLVILMAPTRGYVHGSLDVLTDFGKIVIIYFLLVNLINTEKRLKTAIWLLVLSTTYISVQGILASRGAISVIELAGGYRVEGTGIFGDPNDLALAIVTVLPFVFYLFFEGSVGKKALALASGSAMLYCFLLTGSRGGAIGLTVITFLFLRKKSGIVLGAIFVVAALAGLLALSPGYAAERYKAISPYEGTGQGRIELWYTAFSMFRSSPILGIGKDNFGENVGHVPHNSAVHIATETGLIGLLIWISMFYFAFRNLMKYSPDSRFSISDAPQEDSASSSQHPVASIKLMFNYLKLSLIGFLVCGSFLSRQYNYVPYVLIAISTAACNIAAGEDKTELTSVSAKDVKGIIISTFSFLVLWMVILKAFA